MRPGPSRNFVVATSDTSVTRKAELAREPSKVLDISFGSAVSATDQIEIRTTPQETVLSHR